MSESLKGRADSGRAKTSVTTDSLHIYIQEGYDNPAAPPFDLKEELTRLSGISLLSHVALFQWALSESNLNEIEDLFDRRGISKTIPDLKTLDPENFWSDPRSRPRPFKASVPRSGIVRERVLKSCSRDGQMTMPRQHEVQKFLNEIQQDASLRRQALELWNKVDPTAVFSHACALENVDLTRFFQPRIGSFHHEVKRRGGDVSNLSISFRADPPKERKMGMLDSFPAIVALGQDGAISIQAYGEAGNVSNEEVLFAGEITVGYATWRRKELIFD
jgi:hypothetical protein